MDKKFLEPGGGRHDERRINDEISYTFLIFMENELSAGGAGPTPPPLPPILRSVAFFSLLHFN